MKENSLSMKSIMVFIISLIAVTFIIPAIIVKPNSNQTVSSKENQNINKEEYLINHTEKEKSMDIKLYRMEKKIVETIPLEEYVVGVVASEMPATFEIEALKAQSLAARTFIVKRLLLGEKSNTPENADITDSFKYHQVYKSNNELLHLWGDNYESNMKKVQYAVNSTKGQIITYNGEPIEPSYFSTSNGRTENSEDYWSYNFPYLRSVESPWDKDSPKFANKVVLSISEIEKALNVKLDPELNNIGDIKLTNSNRVDTIEIGNKEVSGVVVREQLGLPSNDFKVVQNGEKLVFSTKGFGHGVGMSQYGANGMAKEGKDYKSIINHYYQGVELGNLGELNRLAKN